MRAWAKMSLSPPSAVKHTGQKSGGELCEILKFGSFLQSKSVNNVCKLSQTPAGVHPRTPMGTSVPQTPWAIVSPNENS